MFGAIIAMLVVAAIIAASVIVLVRTPKAHRRAADGNTDLALNESERQAVLQNLATASQVQMLSRDQSQGM